MDTSMDPEKVNKQMMQYDPGYWAWKTPIKLQSSPFTFVGREYQVESMSSNIRRTCHMKGTQIFGATEIQVLKSLHGMIMGKYLKGVAYIFPTNDEVGEFSKSRFNPLIAANRASIGKYVRDQKSKTDTTSLKKVRESFLYLRGARQSQKIGDSAESTSSKTAGIPVDRVVFDEVDYMDVRVIEKYKGRMRESPHKEEVYLGNPSHEDFGIDLIFKQSDQRYWFRKCSCGHWTCAEKSFPNCVKIRPNGTGYIGCDKCGKELPPWAGPGSAEWVPDFPDKTKFMQGYMASEMISPRCDPAEILEDIENPPFGNLADVYRLRLGRPYSNRDEKLKKRDVLACCGNDVPATSHGGPCAMGVDVGKVKHIVIGYKTGRDQYEIVKTAVIPESTQAWNEIYSFAKKFNVQSTVIDIAPYYDAARLYQQNCRHKVFLCRYSDTQTADATFNDNTGIVSTNRTEIFDRSHRVVMRGHIKLSCQCPETEEFARQCCNCAKFGEKDKRSGAIVFRYRPTGDRQEHFRNALNYFLLAASKHRIGTVSRYPNTTADVESDYERV